MRVVHEGHEGTRRRNSDLNLHFGFLRDLRVLRGQFLFLVFPQRRVTGNAVSIERTWSGRVIRRPYLFMLAVSAFFRDSNYLECAMWCSIGVAFLIRAMMHADHRTPVIITGITFLFFGASDYVEAQTGAWWRPVGLLVWKGLCLLIFLILLIRYAKEKRAKAIPDTAVPSRSSSHPEACPDRNPYPTARD